MKCQNVSCQVEVPRKNGTQRKFCSRSCAAVVNNKLHPKRIGTGSIKICERCGEKFKGASSRRYCSRVCFERHRAEQYIDRWLNGEESGSIESGELKETIRRYLLSLANHQCTQCGWGKTNPVTGKVILTIDHIDGNWKNNSAGNLVVICYNCHTLTPTFGSLNRGVNTGPRSVGSRRH